MSSDGAEFGVTASRALDTILGGAPAPAEDEALSVKEMRERVLATSYDYDWSQDFPPYDGRERTAEEEAAGDAAYENCAMAAAHAILDAFVVDPGLVVAPTEMDYDWDADPDRGAQGMKPEYLRSRGLYALMEERAPAQYEALHRMGLSGFQWGWAVNAARRCIQLAPVPNPAILTIDTARLRAEPEPPETVWWVANAEQGSGRFTAHPELYRANPAWTVTECRVVRGRTR